MMLWALERTKWGTLLSIGFQLERRSESTAMEKLVHLESQNHNVLKTLKGQFRITNVVLLEH